MDLRGFLISVIGRVPNQRSLPGLGKLHGFGQGNYWKVGCFGEPIDLWLKYRIIRVESQLFNLSWNLRSNIFLSFLALTWWPQRKMTSPAQKKYYGFFMLRLWRFSRHLLLEETTMLCSPRKNCHFRIYRQNSALSSRPHCQTGGLAYCPNFRETIPIARRGQISLCPLGLPTYRHDVHGGLQPGISKALTRTSISNLFLAVQ